MEKIDETPGTRPLLEEVAELSSDLETLGNSKSAEEVYGDLINASNQFKNELS